MATLALGTVQFGLPYGVANTTGQAAREEIAAILACARTAGLHTLDTAMAYGDSESRLGDAGVSQWRVVTKLPAMPASCTDPVQWAETAVAQSLRKLRLPRIYGLLLHRSSDLAGPHGAALYAVLQRLKARGLVEKIGVSIYNSEELEVLWAARRPDLVQAPFNIVDRRIAASGWLARLKDDGVEVHVRSVFLQGLLLMSPDSRPQRFAPWKPLWDTWHEWLDAIGMTPLQACLGFAMHDPNVDCVVVGVEREAQLREIMVSVPAHAAQPPASLANSDPELINPLRWLS